MIYDENFFRTRQNKAIYGYAQGFLQVLLGIEVGNDRAMPGIKPGTTTFIVFISAL